MHLRRILIGTILISMALGSASAPGLDVYVEAQGAGIDSDVRILEAPGGSVRVHATPIAVLTRRNVIGVRGVIVPVEIVAADGSTNQSELYQVVFDLTEDVQTVIQKAIDANCGWVGALVIARDDVVVDYIVLRRCVRSALKVTFPTEKQAQQAVRRYVDAPIVFVEPTPRGETKPSAESL